MMKKLYFIWLFVIIINSVFAGKTTINNYKSYNTNQVWDNVQVNNKGTLVLNSLANGNQANYSINNLTMDGTLIVNQNATLTITGSSYVLKSENAITGEGTIIFDGPVTVEYGTGNTNEVLFETNVVLNNADISLPSNSTIEGSLTINENLTNPLPGDLSVSGEVILGDNVDLSGISFPVSDLIVEGGTVQISNNTLYENVNVKSTGILQINLTGKLNIKGDLNVEEGGSVNDSGQGISFSGAIPQSISGTFEVSSIEIENTDDIVSITAGDVNIIDYLDLRANTILNTNDLLTLKSSPGNYAVVKALGSGAQLIGNITYQKRIASSNYGWRYYGSSVKSLPASDWQDEISFNRNIYWYDESKPTSKSTEQKGWVRVNTSSSLSSGRGYAVRSSGNATLEETGLPVIGDGIDNTLSSNGTEYFDFGITYTHVYSDNGYNLVANPYPAFIDWDAAGWNKSNINDALYVWNPQTGSYSTYINGVGVNGGSNILAPGQAFFVQANASTPSLQISENAKIYDNSTSLMRMNNQSAELRISLIDVNKHSDETVIRLQEGATFGFDGSFDAAKMDGSFVNISSFASDGKEVSINSLPLNFIRYTIPLEVKSTLKGIHTLALNIQNFYNQKVLLQDNYLDVVVDLDTTSQYNFDINSDVASFGSERFEIIFTQQVQLSLEDQIGTYGDVVEIPVTVKNFEEVLTAQLGIIWDTEKLAFQSVSHYGIASLNDSHFNVDSLSGNLVMAWDDANLSPQSLLDDSSLFVIEFLVKALPGSSASLSFDKELINPEIAGGDFQAIAARFSNGKIIVSRNKTISGSIKDIHGRALTNVKIKTKGDSSFTIEPEANGFFQFDIQADHSIELSVEEKNSTDFAQGISTLDILLIRRHVLNTGQFDHELMQYAADVNGSGTVTSLDIALIRKMILGLADDFPIGKPWRFFNSFNQNETVNVTDVDQSYDFIGVKLGDINNSWKETNQRMQYDHEMFVNINDQQVRKGQEVVIPVTVAEFKEIAGYQFSINWNQDILKFERIENVSFINNINESRVTEGSIAVQWDDEQGKGMSLEDGSVLFNLVFEANGMTGDETSIEVTSEITEASAFNNSLQQIGIATSAARIKVADAMESNLETGIQLTNYPNPFQETTTISFQLDSESDVNIRIIDQQGRMIDSIRNLYSAGNHQLEWNTFGKSVQPGLYFIQMTAKGQQFSRKMIIR